MSPILKTTEVLINQSKASLDEKFCLLKSQIFQTQQLEKCLLVWKSTIPRSIFWSMIYVALKFALSVTEIELTSIANKLWTRMEC